MEIATTKKEDMRLGFPVGSWGTEDLENSDTIIPRLLLMQGLSDFVSQGKAQSGELVNSVTGEKLGNKDRPVELLLVDSFKDWVVMEKPKGANKYSFKARHQWKDGDPTWAKNWEEVHPNGLVERRYQQLNFYVLEVKKLNDVSCMPLLLTFRSTSYKTGKQIATFGNLAKAHKRPLGHWLIKLGCKSEKNDLGTYFVFHVERDREAKQEELAKAWQWYETIRSKSVKVAEEGDDSDVPF